MPLFNTPRHVQVGCYNATHSSSYSCFGRCLRRSSAARMWHRCLSLHLSTESPAIGRVVGIGCKKKSKVVLRRDALMNFMIEKTSGTAPWRGYTPKKTADYCNNSSTTRNRQHRQNQAMKNGMGSWTSDPRGRPHTQSFILPPDSRARGPRGWRQKLARCVNASPARLHNPALSLNTLCVWCVRAK